MPLAVAQLFVSLDHFFNRISNTVIPEDLRDILFFILDEFLIRGGIGSHVKWETGFETATDEELHIAFGRTANEMVMRIY